MKIVINILFLILILFFSQKIMAQEKSEPVLERFEYDQVELTDGRLKHQLDHTVELYLNIPNKDLLKGFRERAGLQTRGAKDLGGWYTGDVFHAFGQYLSGLSRLYVATGNEACRNKVNELIEGWAETIEPDGYFFYTQKPNAPHYVYEKMQAGLLDAYLFAGNESALKHMSLITDWAIENLHPERRYPYIPGQRNVEWYTLSENLYRAYLETREEKYRTFAKYWEYPKFWNAIRNEENIFDNKVRYHAYSHLNSLSGAAMAYKVNNDKNYLNTAIKGYDFFVNQQAYITGGFGPIEQLVSNDDKRIVTNFTQNTFETQCGSWAGFKLSKYLLEFTGNGKYGDWIEKLLINGIGASVPMLPSGEVMYYSDYNCKQAVKSNYTNKWSCCTGTRPQAIADYVNLIYFKDDNGMYVNYFTSSTVRWNDVVLEQITEFPEEPTTVFTVNTSSSKQFDINIRKPVWVEDMAIKVNDKIVKATEKNGWVTITRAWKKGDKIEAAMPMRFKAERLHPEHPYPIAMAYGPVALAALNSGDKYPVSIFNESHPGENLISEPGKKLTWRDKNHPDWTIRGYFQLKENEPYVLYVDKRAERVVPNDHIVTSGNWSSRSFYRSAAIGSSIATEGNGAGMRLVCYKGANGGKLKVEFNGKDAGVIDLYAEGERIIEFYDFKDYTSGKQSIKVTVLPEKNEKSSGNMVAILGFEKL